LFSFIACEFCCSITGGFINSMGRCTASSSAPAAAAILTDRPVAPGRQRRIPSARSANQAIHLAGFELRATILLFRLRSAPRTRPDFHCRNTPPGPLDPVSAFAEEALEHLRLSSRRAAASAIGPDFDSRL
jgi:hypothetical protein